MSKYNQKPYSYLEDSDIKSLPSVPQSVTSRSLTDPPHTTVTSTPPSLYSPRTSGAEPLARVSRRQLPAAPSPPLIPPIAQQPTAAPTTTPMSTPTPTATDDDLPPIIYNSRGEVVPSMKVIPSSALTQLLQTSRPSSHFYQRLFDLFSSTYGVARATFALYGNSKDKFDVCRSWMQVLTVLEFDTMLQQRSYAITHCCTNHSRIFGVLSHRGWGQIG